MLTKCVSDTLVVLTSQKSSSRNQQRGKSRPHRQSKHQFWCSDNVWSRLLALLGNLMRTDFETVAGNILKWQVNFSTYSTANWHAPATAPTGPPPDAPLAPVGASELQWNISPLSIWNFRTEGRWCIELAQQPNTQRAVWMGFVCGGHVAVSLLHHRATLLIEWDCPAQCAHPMTAVAREHQVLLSPLHCWLLNGDNEAWHIHPFLYAGLEKSQNTLKMYSTQLGYKRKIKQNFSSW